MGAVCILSKEQRRQRDNRIDMQILRLVSCARTVLRRSFSSQNKCSDLVLVRQENGVRSITLNNSRKRNVLSLEMITAISDALADQDNSLRCVLLAAEGNVFSAGHDLQELGQELMQAQVLQAAAKLMIQLRDLSVPTVAKVGGPVVAAGVQLVASCDIILASDCSTFSTPGIDWSVCCMTPIVAVSRSASTKASALMLLTGRPLTAAQALSSGLISAHCPKHQLDSLTQDILTSLLQKSKPILSLGKSFFYKQLDMGLEEAYEKGCQAMCRNIQHPDAQRGIHAFANKQRPVWTHEPWQ